MLWEFVYNTLSGLGAENLHFDPFSFVGRVSKRCSMFVWIIISMVAYTFWIRQDFVKATSLLIFWHGCFAHLLLLGNTRNLYNGLILSLKFYFEKQNELV